MSRLPRDGDILDLEIDGVDDEGRGRATFGTHHDMPIDYAVRGVLPGDRVRASVERVFGARALATARVLEVLQPGTLHVARTCPHDAPCPGCPLEGADAGFALALKRERVARALVDAGLHDAADEVDDVVPSRARRQKVKLTAGGTAGHIRLGLFVPHSHGLVGSEGCPQQHAAISAALAVLGPALDASGVPPGVVDPQGIKAVIVRVFQEGVGAVVVTGAPLSGEAWRHLGACVDGVVLSAVAVRVDDVGPGKSANSLVGGTVQTFTGPQKMTPLEGGVPEGVDAFCQTDPELAAFMYARAARFLEPCFQGESNGEAVIADLYAGTGGFSRALLAAGARRITAVERSPESASSLAQLAVETVTSSVEAALPRLRERAPRGMVLDPPKSGLKEASRALAGLHAQRVVLVACDPDAGARDARAFVDAGYRIEGIEPLDLFPATPEVEVMFLLSR